MRYTEHEEQKKVFQWAKLNEKKHPELFFLNSSQNGIKFANSKIGLRAKQTGLKKGFPDIFLPKTNKKYCGLFIELKTKENKNLNIKKGRLSPEQKIWIDFLNNNCYNAVVCYGAIEAIQVIEDYLNIE